MADPLSLVSAVAGLVVFGTKLTSVISTYIDATRNAPAQVHALNTNLTTLMTVLQNFHKFLNDSPNTLQSVPTQSVDELRVVLDGCMSILFELQGTINKLLTSTGGHIARLGRRLQWVMKEKDLNTLLRSLEMYKMTINLTLNLATLSQTNDVNNRTFRMELKLSEMHRLLRRFAAKVEPSETGSIRESIFGVDSDSESIASASYQSSIVIERYLSGLGSVYSSSRPSSIITPLYDEDMIMSSESQSTSTMRIPTASQVDESETRDVSSRMSGSTLQANQHHDHGHQEQNATAVFTGQSQNISGDMSNPKPRELVVKWKELEPSEYLSRKSYLLNSDDLVKTDQYYKENYTRVSFLAIGNGACGKSCVFDRFLTGAFPERWEPCVFDYLHTYRELNVEIPELPLVDTIWIQLNDVTGLEDYIELRALAYPGADFIMICFSLENRDSLLSVKEHWMTEMREATAADGGGGVKPFVLVGCWKDTRDELKNGLRKPRKGEDEISTEEGREVAREIGALEYFECSGKTGEGIEELFQRCCGLALAWRLEQRLVGQGKKKQCVVM